jgi:integrase
MRLPDARQAASDALRLMRLGTDPREAKRSAARNAERQRKNTVAAVAEDFIREHVSTLRGKGRTERDIRRHLIGAWGNRQIATVTVEDIGELVRSIVDDGKPEAARRVLGYTKRLFRWAAAPGRARANGNPTLALSARHDFGIIASPRQVSLSPDHLRLIWNAAGRLGEPHGPFFRMLLLSGQRRGEVAKMTWDELDLDREQVWIIPADRMKAARPHEVPMSPAMVALLIELREHRSNGPYVFSVAVGERPISSFIKPKVRLDKLIAEARAADGLPPVASWTIHDIRRAVRTGLGAIPSIPHDIRELVIAHVPPALVQTYDLHGYRDEKRQALTLWRDRLARIVEPATDNVLRIAR